MVPRHVLCSDSPQPHKAVPTGMLLVVPAELAGSILEYSGGRFNIIRFLYPVNLNLEFRTFYHRHVPKVKSSFLSKQGHCFWKCMMHAHTSKCLCNAVSTKDKISRCVNQNQNYLHGQIPLAINKKIHLTLSSQGIGEIKLTAPQHMTLNTRTLS